MIGEEIAIELFEKQHVWEFGVDYPCRSCVYLHLWWDEKERAKCMCGCGARRLRTLAGVTVGKCAMWRKGVEVMSFIDFRKMSEEQLKKELENIRKRRRGVGRHKRMQSRERRVKDATKSKKAKEEEENAEWV